VHSDFPNADLQKEFANKIKRVQACLDTHRHHFQHLLELHSDFPNALYDVLATIDSCFHLECQMAIIFQSVGWGGGGQWE
jgi:hypothetical protein